MGMDREFVCCTHTLYPRSQGSRAWGGEDRAMYSGLADRCLFMGEGLKVMLARPIERL